MRKIMFSILVAAALLFRIAEPSRAQNVSDHSAYFKIAGEGKNFDYRIENLRQFLEEYNSPLGPYAKDFVTCADENGIDYRLVPAIAGVESTFGKRTPTKSYNAYGWANGAYRFTSWEDSIEHVSKTLRISYIDKGAGSVYEIAKIYAPPSSTWGGKVSFFISKIDTLPLNFDII